MPHLMRRQRTVTRVSLAVLGAGALLLMQMQVPAGIGSLSWGTGYWLGVALFVVTGFYAVYVLGTVHGRQRRRR